MFEAKNVIIHDNGRVIIVLYMDVVGQIVTDFRLFSLKVKKKKKTTTLAYVSIEL
jgi:hypothetical protein